MQKRNLLTRLLLLFALIVGGTSVWAGEITLDWTSSGPTLSNNSFTQDGITGTFTKGTGANANSPAYYSNGLRMYAGWSMSLNAGDKIITNIVYTYTVTTDKNIVVSGAIGKTNSGTWDANSTTWSGSDSEVTFTTTGSTGNVAFSKIVITYEDSGSGETTDPDPEGPSTEPKSEVCYKKVTNVNNLNDGDAILIVNESNGRALSTTQNSNNRAATEVTITNNVIYSISDNVLRIVLEREDDNFYFNVGGNNYLYAASNSSNHLKTQSKKDNNAKASIEVNSDSGEATIKFQGSYSHNLMRYNANNGTPIFSCYLSGQEPVQIYKETKIMPVTITDAEYATFAADYAIDLSETGITAYTAKDEGTYVSLTEIEGGKVPANTPVVLYKEGADGSVINVPVIADIDPVVDENDLRVSTGTDVDNMYVLANKNSRVGFYKWAGSDLKAGKVYLLGSTTTGARDFLGFDNETTGISTTLMNNEAKNKEYYNLAGQRVAQPTKGLYIVNGKKVIIK
ncbi:MAG: hypothetical protein J1E37_03130 [Prevotella sp.]|nr:hypothetical protein [Prevotella sp.]